jgi:hypothetical protein
MIRTFAITLLILTASSCGSNLTSEDEIAQTSQSSRSISQLQDSLAYFDLAPTFSSDMSKMMWLAGNVDSPSNGRLVTKIATISDGTLGEATTPSYEESADSRTKSALLAPNGANALTERTGTTQKVWLHNLSVDQLTDLNEALTSSTSAKWSADGQLITYLGEALAGETPSVYIARFDLGTNAVTETLLLSNKPSVVLGPIWVGGINSVAIITASSSGQSLLIFDIPSSGPLSGSSSRPEVALSLRTDSNSFITADDQSVYFSRQFTSTADSALSVFGNAEPLSELQPKQIISKITLSTGLQSDISPTAPFVYDLSVVPDGSLAIATIGNYLECTGLSRSFLKWIWVFNPTSGATINTMTRTYTSESSSMTSELCSTATPPDLKLDATVSAPVIERNSSSTAIKFSLLSFSKENLDSAGTNLEAPEIYLVTGDATSAGLEAKNLTLHAAPL